MDTRQHSAEVVPKTRLLNKLHPDNFTQLVFGIFASIAEFERELIRDRVRSGPAAAKARCK